MADEMQSLRPPASRCPTGSKLQAGFFRLVLPRGVCRPRMAEGIDHEEATPCEHHSRPPRDGERFAAVSEGQHLEPDARLSAREPVVIEAKKRIVQSLAGRSWSLVMSPV